MKSPIRSLLHSSAMGYSNILYEVRERAAWITINRPEVRNALDVATKEEMLRALGEAEADPNVVAVVITGAGDKAFCAGADLRMFLGMDEAAARQYLIVTKGLVDRIEGLSKPVLAAVNGHAFGGGLELVLASDIAVAVEDALLGQTELNVGLIPGAGGTQRLPRHVGIKRAKEMIFSGRPITAREAEALGIINRAVPRQEFAATVERYLDDIRSKSPLILSFAKRALNASFSRPFEEGMREESELFARCFSTEDQKEGARAFLEKRKPEWRGR
ncbi:MAG: enoyl-CoA hydratase/isomerase family protein [Conexivisphaera sp.]